MSTPSDTPEIRIPHFDSVRIQYMPRDTGTELQERMARLGVPVVAWWWVEQGGPCMTRQRFRGGVQGDTAVPLVPIADVLDAIGVTQEDVVKLRSIARTIEGEDAPLTAARVNGIADKIAALLPPKEAR